jgi:hypothetical protein
MRELQPEALRRLNKHLFERFCERLLEVEYETRFEPGAVEFEGTAEEDVPDGARDLRAIVTREPIARSHWALLPDQPCDAWYSCKSHKDDGHEREPRGWRKQVRNDVDPSPRIVDGNTGELYADADERAARKDKRPPPRDLLSALAEGGCYVVLVNVRAERQVEFERELRTVFDYWIRKLIDADASLGADAVRIRDATYLARVFNARPFALPPDLERRLAIAEPRFLADWRRWTQRYTRDRRDMKWEPDARRQALDAKLRAFLTSEERAPVFRLWGPPGVGKTRLVHHVLGDAGVTGRVRFSEDVPEVRSWLTDPYNHLAGDMILVVDEVAPTDAAGLARDFRAHGPPKSRLVMVGPQELDHQGQPEPELLDRLDDAQTRAILINEMGAGDARIELALGLCRGYPLFAYWLGHALANDPGLLAAPGAALTGDDDPWDATCAVLVGPRGADERAWRGQATRRGKALLLASLTTGHPWSRLEDDERRAFADALGLSWAELETAAVECVSRSLLRVHGELRYVSPANLERLVLNHFFSDKGPGGPPLDPRRLARELVPFFDGLLTRARAVHASDSCKRNLAHGALSEIESAARSRDLARLGRVAPLLGSASHVAPEDAVTVIETVVDALGVATIVTGPLADALTMSLRHINHRRISASTFERAESLLFKLARQEQPANSLPFEAPHGWARSCWMSLFDPVVHLTRQPFELRFELLSRRLHSKDPDERALAVDALGLVLGPPGGGWAGGWDDVDGPWEHEQRSPPDYGARLGQTWSALLDASEDRSEVVRGRARKLIANRLRFGLEGGLRPAQVDRLAQLVSGWSVDERERLSEQVDDVVRYDLDSLGQRSTLSQAFTHLREAVEPGSLEELIIAQVGRWHPGPWPINVEDRTRLEQHRDLDLARALVADPALLTMMLPWLTSPKAVRARQFAHALGQADRPQQLLEILRDNVHDIVGYRFTAAYLVGWLEAVGDATFDHWLDAARACESPVLLARVLTMAVADNHRARLLLELLRTHELPGLALAGFGFFAPWAKQVSTELLDQLLIELSGSDDGSFTTEGVGLLETRLHRAADDLTPEVREAAHELLERQTGTPSSIVARAWTRSVVALAEHGDLRPFLVALELATDNLEYPHHIVEVLRAITEAGLGDRVWPAVTRLLASSDEADRTWLVRMFADARLPDGVTSEHILDWVGDDERRAAEVAGMITPLWMTPGELARALVSRFGANSQVGEVLARGADEHLDLDAWLSAADPELRRWATARVVERGTRSASGG